MDKKRTGPTGSGGALMLMKPTRSGIIDGVRVFWAPGLQIDGFGRELMLLRR